MSATYVGVTPSLPSYNPNANRTDERPVQLTRTDRHGTQTDGHVDNHGTLVCLKHSCQNVMFSCEQSFSSTIPPSIVDALEKFSLELRPNYFRFWIPLFVQPCGHSGVCKKCAGEILFCPTCFGLVEGCRDPKFTVPLRPLAFGL